MAQVFFREYQSAPIARESLSWPHQRQRVLPWPSPWIYLTYLPFGGVKQSGLGKDLGPEAMDIVKSIQSAGT
jgi:hypothetical protein